MTGSAQTISPRGIPPIRTDWLADVARRLAVLGIDRLRAIGEQPATLTDLVDGQPWRFAALRLSEPWDTTVELDADLFLPTDTDRATLRAGFALGPRWDAELGDVVQVRVEIGPRGAVTFDPENWMLTIPLQPAGQPPAPAGVEPGSWELGMAAWAPELALPSMGPPSPDDAPSSERLALIGTELRLGSLAPLLEGQALPELVLPAFAPVAAKGLLRRLGRSRAAHVPTAVLHLRASGPLALQWTGAGEAAALPATGLPAIEDVSRVPGQVTITNAAGTLVLSGPHLRVHVVPVPTR